MPDLPSSIAARIQCNRGERCLLARLEQLKRDCGCMLGENRKIYSVLPKACTQWGRRTHVEIKIPLMRVFSFRVFGLFGGHHRPWQAVRGDFALVTLGAFPQSPV